MGGQFQTGEAKAFSNHLQGLLKVEVWGAEDEWVQGITAAGPIGTAILGSSALGLSAGHWQTVCLEPWVSPAAKQAQTESCLPQGSPGLGFQCPQAPGRPGGVPHPQTCLLPVTLPLS